MNGLVFNIQKFSIHDGPGIRTTVFLKGCPLRCKWCANPESQSQNIQITYDVSKCLHCLNCVKICPQQAITHLDSHITINESLCIGCLQCVHQCPAQALGYEGKWQELDEVVNICLQDLPFYEESQGGVTISGGEGMGQPAFVMALVDKLKQHHIHVAIETTGYVAKETFRQLASMFDLLLFDVKHADEKKHLEGTGVSLALIRDNLAWAIKKQIPILPRIPVIPDFNDSLEDAKKIATYLNELGLSRVQLLPFHQFGEKKYHLLNRDYAYEGVSALYPEDLQDYQQIFLDANIDCFF